MKLKVDNVVIEIDEDDVFQLISLLAESYSINAYMEDVLEKPENDKYPWSPWSIWTDHQNAEG